MDKGKRLCCIFNFPPHYRSAVYKLIDKELNADFYFGDRIFSSIKTIEYSELAGFKRLLKFVKIYKNLYYQIGSVTLSFKPYSRYLVTGEVNCLSTWILLVVNKVLGKRTYLWSHGYYGKEKSIKRKIKKIYFGLATGVFLYGEHARNLMIKTGLNPQNLHLIYNSMDYDNQIIIRKNLKKEKVFKDLFNGDYPTIVFIGRLQRVKKIDILIKAISKLKNKGVNINLLLIGNHDVTLGLEKLATNLNLNSNICFYGPCYDENVIGKFIYNADLCVSPGNVGLTAIHSLIYGTPVLTHNNFDNQMPEFEAIEKGVTGDFYIENNINDLCHKINQWINKDTQTRFSIREKAFKTIDEKYNPYKQIEILKSVFDSIN